MTDYEKLMARVTNLETAIISFSGIIIDLQPPEQQDDIAVVMGVMLESAEGLGRLELNGNMTQGDWEEYYKAKADSENGGV